MLLGLTFVILKLTHVIDWSWWWVLLPFYGLLALAALLYAIAGLMYLFESPEDRKRRKAVEALGRYGNALSRSRR
jgi:hypothetical protein